MGYPQLDRDRGLKSVEVQGKQFTKYDAVAAMKVIERIADGELLKDICNPKDPDAPVSKSTFMRWVANVPELAKAYAAAQQISALSFEEEAIDAARRIRNAPGSAANVSAANTFISQMRWSATRRNPTKYSDKGNTAVVVPVNISSTLNLGNAKQNIDVEIPDMYTISFTPDSAPAKEAEVEEGEYTEITHEEAKKDILAMVPEVAKNDGVIRKPKFVPKSPRGPQKRVLVPGHIKDAQRAAKKAEKEKNNG